ncbi:MAG: hypothetical protein KDI46_00160 [Alphaproteobacteria bacterium]|nr:hypothetical protein [Alphaproteobacteria bacterium]
MSELSIFAPDEVELLARALFKVGAWISYAEDEEGEADDEQEMKALAACIRAVAKKHDGPGLVDDIARETLARQDQWENWAEDSFHALDECAQAVALLKSRAPASDVKNYKAALMEVAVTVAQASGEFGQYDDEDIGLFGALLGKITGAFSGLTADDAGHPMNVSAAEDEALGRLRKLLKD